ncbi:MAG: oligosaccharide flippase family protein [Acidiferrobacteraceae bacterium]
MEVSIRRRLLSGGLWAVLGQVLRMLLGLISSALVARLLPVSAFGIYFIAISIVDALALVGQGGFQGAVVRVVAESVGLKHPARAKAAIKLALLGGSAGIAIAVTLFWFQGQRFAATVFHSPLLGEMTGLIVLWAVIMTLQQLVAESFRGLHDIRMATLFGRLLPSSLVCVLFAVQWLVKGSSGLHQVLILWIVGSGVSLMVGFTVLMRRARDLSRDPTPVLPVQQMTAIAWPIAVSTITFFVVAQADLWILAIFRSAREVAAYGAALRLATLIGAPLLVANLVLPPLIAEIFAKGDRETLEKVLRTTATIAAIPAVLVVVAVIFGHNELVTLVYGARYVNAGELLVILSIGQLVSVLSGSCGFTLAMTRHQTTMMIVSLVSGFVTIALAVVLARSAGAVGVAVAAATGLTLQNIAMTLLVKVRLGIRTYITWPRMSWLDDIKVQSRKRP